ncbi:hypothetical protein Anas_07422 [Armadillidium nasatum]|uniref:CCHC-type domain-containing protein n=1 Tax=Armadillidium nasatum TaxID=96803 RepID=A0A5N5TK78_9CRUS|nr:hypothetical protein Anas_07422 [Armadillidium nasatum]
MGKTDTKTTDKESEIEAREEALKNEKRNLFRDTEGLKQTVSELEQVQIEAEAKLKVYSNDMERLEMYDDISKEEENLEVTKGEQEKENSAMDSSEILENSQPSSSSVPRSSRSSSQVPSGSVPLPSQSSNEVSSNLVPHSSSSSSEVTSAGTEEVFVETQSRNENGRHPTAQANLNPSANEFKPQLDISAINVLMENASLHRPEPPCLMGILLHTRPGKWPFILLWKPRYQTSESFYITCTSIPVAKVQELVNAYISTDYIEAYKDAREALEERYGNMHIVSNTLKKQLDSWPFIKAGDALALRKFADFLKKCEVVKASTQGLNGLDDTDRILSLLKKLPAHIIHKWNDYAFKYVESMPRNHGGYPGFSNFVKFITDQARQACFSAPTLQAERQTQGNGKPSYKETSSTRSVRSFATEAAVTNDHRDRNVTTLTCIYCNQNHGIGTCNKFANIPIQERKYFVKEKRLCWNCLRSGHVARFCRDPNRCRTCNGFHHTFMHEERVSFEQRAPRGRIETTGGVTNKEREQAIVNKIDTSEDNVSYQTQALILPIWVHSHDFPVNRVLTYAMLDHQSNTSFIKDSLFKRLNLAGSPVDLSIKTISGTELAKSIKCNNLILQGLRSKEELQLRSSYVKEDIAADRASIPNKEVAKRYEHLQEIYDKIEPEIPTLEVEMLIGLDCQEAIEPLKIVTGKRGTPFGFKSRLGWGIIGRASETFSNSLQASELKVIVNHSIVTFRSETKELNKHENVRKEERTRPEDKLKIEFKNQNKGLVRDSENTKMHLNNKENLQEQVTTIKELKESNQMLKSKVEDILECKENDRLLNERQHEELKQQRLLERQSFEALLNEKERDKRNLLDIIQEKEETEQKMANFIKERELEIKNLHAVNESEKRNLSKEISEANSEIQRLRELLTKKDQVMLKAKKENEDSIKERQDDDAEHSNEEPVLTSRLENERAEVATQMKNNKENMQAKSEICQEKSKREFSEMDKEKQKMKVQAWKGKGGKEKTPIKNENTRNNWRLAIARKAFIGQDRRVKRAWLRFGKRILGREDGNPQFFGRTRIYCGHTGVSRRSGFPTEEPYLVQSHLDFGGAIITYIKRRNCIIKCSQEKLRLISELFVITYSKCKPALIPETFGTGFYIIN